MNTASCRLHTGTSGTSSNLCMTYAESAGHSEQSLTPCTTLPAEYTPFSLDWKCAYKALYATQPTHPLAYSMPNLWAWKEWMELEVRFAHSLAWLRCQRHGKHHLAPVGAWKNVNWQELEPVLREMESIYQVPEPLARMWEAQLSCPVRVIENRDYWEYLYTTEDLANLAGNRYHMQRNHVNAFVRQYGACDVRPLGAHDAADMLALADMWLAQATPSPTAKAERVSLERICAAWDDLELVGLGLYLPDGLAAFSIGHRLDATTLGVMYEKARPGLRGAFPAMTRSFAQIAGQGFDLLNRAEDMGDAGMRNAKTLYRPVDFQRMCTVYIGGH